MGIATGLMSAALISSVARGAEPPSLADAQADFTARQYRPCLVKISQFLAGPAGKIAAPQRFDALMLRGECMLQLKENALAADAFTSASKVPLAPQDLNRLATARATAALIRASHNLKYQPALGGDAIDIVAPESRKLAMLALVNDRFTDAEPKIAQALSATNLVPIHDLVPLFGDLYALELTATGKTTRTMPAIKGVGAHARELINAELIRIGKRVDELNMLASEPYLSSDGRTLSNRGLNTLERNELKDLADYLTRIDKTAQTGRRINRELGGTGDVWDSILAECDDIRDRAQQAYDRRY